MKGGVVSAMPQLDLAHASYLCPNCGVPRDYEHFDKSGFADTPAPGREVVLARFELQPEYCGLLENFSQFTNQLGHLGQVETPGLQWIITVNNHPLYPYIKLDHIANPWGFGSFGVSIRLDENRLFRADRERNHADRRTDCWTVLVQLCLWRCHSTRLPV
jgi:hypothetical protein